MHYSIITLGGSQAPKGRTDENCMYNQRRRFLIGKNSKLIMSSQQLPLSITVEKAASIIKNNPNSANFQLLDVRTSFESFFSTINNSLHIPLGQLMERSQELSPQISYLVYCRSGVRSERAVQILKSIGIKATSIAGGMNLWKASEEPVHQNCAIY